MLMSDDVTKTVRENEAGSEKRHAVQNTCTNERAEVKSCHFCLAAVKLCDVLSKTLVFECEHAEQFHKAPGVAT